MARQRRRAATAAQTAPQSVQPTTETPKSFGRPRPVVCDEEAGWFDEAHAAEATQAPQADAARTYIEERFQDLLEPEEIESLATNEVMLAIVAEHRKLFRAQAENDAQAA